MRAAWLIPLVLLAACDQEMEDMPHIRPLEERQGQASWRIPVEGTVAMDDELGDPPDEIPFPVTLDLLERGRERYGIFCSPCHARTGQGNGLVVQAGFPRPPSLHDPALLSVPDRHFYDVITHGYGAMHSYAARVPKADRWAIAAYIRALQLSRRAPAAALPEDLRARLEAQP